MRLQLLRLERFVESLPCWLCFVAVNSILTIFYLIVNHQKDKKFTDCGEPFEHLNGKMSLEMTIKKQTKWPKILGINAPGMK